MAINPASRGRRCRIRPSTLIRWPWYWWYFETDPVKPCEFVLRTIPDGINYYSPSLPVPINRFAFEPMKRDTDGLSLFRLDFISAKALAQPPRNKKNAYYVARLKVADVLKEGFTIQPKLDPDVPGHVIIPELISYADYKESKKAGKTELANGVLTLAKLAGQRIVLKPSDAPKWLVSGVPYLGPNFPAFVQS